MHHRAKKSLGQNFLKSKRALDAIIDAGDITGDDIVVEIGPGKGALTSKLLVFAGKVIAIEKDDDLFTYLSETYKEHIDSGKLDLIHGDILDFDPEVLRFYNHPYKVIANIPYNITGLILRKFLEASYRPETMVVLVQREVSDRIVARDKKESILSISVKAYGTPKYIMKVPAKDFSPAPKVDSAVLQISNITHQAFIDANVSDARFFEIVRTGFAHKRKVLIKNLETIAERAKIIEVFEAIGLTHKIRPEEVPVSTWFSLAARL